MLSCFFYSGSGERCGARAASGLFCATHLFRFRRAGLRKLLDDAVAAILQCTSFTQEGLLSLACLDVDAWGRLANAVAGLVLNGYRREEDVLRILLSSLLSNTAFRCRYDATVAPKWQGFEILVARLHLQQLSPLISSVNRGDPEHAGLGVKVYWNVKKDGRLTGRVRQIDVTIITQLGLYELFTAIECKDTEVRVEDVEAFVTKLDDIGAHKGVIISSAGFQAGALSAAKAHNVEAIRIVEQQSRMVHTSRTAPSTRPKVLAFTFQPAPTWTGDPRPLSQLSDIRVSLGSGSEIPAPQLAAQALNTGEPTLGSWPPLIEYILPEDSRIILPDGESLPVAQLLLWVEFENISEDFTVMLPEHPVAFAIENLVSGCQLTVPESKVPLLDSPTLSPGQFYVNWMCQFYYCEQVDGNVMTLVLLEDKQHGTRLTVVLKQDIRESGQYFAIEDGRLFQKLRSALSRYRKAQTS